MIGICIKLQVPGNENKWLIGQIQNAKSVHTLFHFDSKTIILRKKFQRCVKSLTNYDSLFFFSQSNSTEKS